MIPLFWERIKKDTLSTIAQKYPARACTAPLESRRRDAKHASCALLFLIRARRLPQHEISERRSDAPALAYFSNPTNTAASSTDFRSDTTAFAGKVSSGQP